MKSIPKGPFLGLNNRRPDTDLHVPKTGDFLSVAENVDIDGAGKIRRRRAFSRIQALTGAHSLFETEDGTHYLVRAGVLYRVTLPTYSETLVKVLAADDAMYFAEFDGSIYCSNGADCGRIEGGNWFPWGLATPDSPAISTITGGLYPGYYQVALSYARLSGSTLLEEGGVSASSNYELLADGGLRVQLPGAGAGATHILVYVSTVNGSIPMLSKTVAVGTGTVDITLQSDLLTGRDAVQRYEVPLPAGRPFIHNSRLCSIVDTRIYLGLPARMGYYVPTDPVLEFPKPVTNAVSAQDGVFVTADKSYWFQGTDLGDVQHVADVLPYGAAANTAFSTPHNSKVGWFGEKGIVIGSPSGEVEAVMSDNVDLTAPDSGVSVVFSDRGYRRVVSCGWCVNLENLAASQYLDYAFTNIAGRYATRADGIYDLLAEGDVDYRVGFGRENFGTEALKHLPAVYLGVSSADPVTLVVDANGEEYTYNARSSSETLKIHRVDPGRGLKANWYGLAITGAADFELASVSFTPSASVRRI